MADAAEETSKPAPKQSGGVMSMLINGIGIFVLSLGAVVAGGFINAKLHPPPEMKLDKEGKITPIGKESGGGGGKGEEGAQKAENYFAIDPPLVVNFEDGAAVRFLQITMEVMSKDPKAIEGVQKNVPLIRNNLLLLMSNRDYQSLMSREGKEKLRQEALAEVKAIQKKEDGPLIDDLLFTSFVVQ